MDEQAPPAPRRRRRAAVVAVAVTVLAVLGAVLVVVLPGRSDGRSAAATPAPAASPAARPSTPAAPTPPATAVPVRRSTGDISQLLAGQCSDSYDYLSPVNPQVSSVVPCDSSTARLQVLGQVGVAGTPPCRGSEMRTVPFGPTFCVRMLLRPGLCVPAEVVRTRVWVTFVWVSPCDAVQTPLAARYHTGPSAPRRLVRIDSVEPTRSRGRSCGPGRYAWDLTDPQRLLCGTVLPAR